MNRTIAAMTVAGTISLACGRSAPVTTSAPTQCEQLGAVALETTIIASAERVTRGVFTPPGAQDPLTNLPPFCRVTGEIRPTSDSHIAFELWMPLENWNGKFAGVGNGGWAGVISYAALAAELRRGYATVSTNTGHVAEPGLDMAKFAYGHPERLADLGWRSVHEMTVKGKAITQAFYGRPARYAYFIGCSTGGKQGLTEAQRFPADYDGIVATAPANGVTDSLITNPTQCAFDPATVQCPPERIRRARVSLLRRCAPRGTCTTACAILRARKFGQACLRGVSRSGVRSPTRTPRSRSPCRITAGSCSAIRTGTGRRSISRTLTIGRAISMASANTPRS